MASPMTSIPQHEVNALLRQVQGNSLFNRQLSSVCQVNGLKSTGVKAELQRRIINLIQETVNHNEVSRFHQVRQSIVNAVAQRSSPSKGPAARSNVNFPQSSLPSALSPSMPQYTAGNYSSAGEFGSGASNGHRSLSSYATTLTPPLSFKPSPFYQIEAPISNVRVCDGK
ncbi:hypothetical protein PT974_02779 [Cladobotryum mycophilum]|uniref:SAP domain-containing protein n=1 Tax=Cladobotryum mycophilum TaxID=491253 RepID=A0ABR0SZ23_9HYPO